MARIEQEDRARIEQEESICVLVGAEGSSPQHRQAPDSRRQYTGLREAILLRKLVIIEEPTFQAMSICIYCSQVPRKSLALVSVKGDIGNPLLNI